MGFVGNYAPCGLSPQTDGMPVIQQNNGKPCNWLSVIFNNERAGIRTPDNLIKSQVLYQLS